MLTSLKDKLRGFPNLTERFPALDPFKSRLRHLASTETERGGVPVVSGWPIVGVLPEMLDDPLKLLTRTAEECGCDIAYLPGVDSYMVGNTEIMRLALLDSKERFIKNPTIMKKIQVAVGSGLSTLNGEGWKKQRRMANPAFAAKSLASFESVFHEEIGKTMEEWKYRDGDTFDVTLEMKRLTLRIVLLCLFSTDISNRADMVIQNMDTLQDYAVYLLWSLFPLPGNIPSRRNQSYKQCQDTLDEVIYSIINERRRNGNEGKSDLLAAYMDAVDDDGSSMDDAQLRNEVMNLFLGGHDTTANSIAFTLHLLSKHPHVREKLEKELDDVLGGRVPTIEDVANLTYMQCVYNESLRLYPPSFAMSRTTDKDIEFDKYRIPSGSDMLLSIWTLHRDPRHWKNPEQFDPDRFSSERSKNRDKYAFLPFGAGPRMCIGAKLARMEANLILGAILQKYRFTSPAGYEPKLLTRLFVTASPGVSMTMARRN